MTPKEQAEEYANREIEAEKLRNIREQKEEEIKYAYLNMSDQTKLVIEDILDMCRLKDPSFMAKELGSSNFNSLLSYREGQRSIGMMINDRMENK